MRHKFAKLTPDAIQNLNLDALKKAQFYIYSLKLPLEDREDIMGRLQLRLCELNFDAEGEGTYINIAKQVAREHLSSKNDNREISVDTQIFNSVSVELEAPRMPASMSMLMLRWAVSGTPASCKLRSLIAAAYKGDKRAVELIDELLCFVENMPASDGNVRTINAALDTIFCHPSTTTCFQPSLFDVDGGDAVT